MICPAKLVLTLLVLSLGACSLLYADSHFVTAEGNGDFPDIQTAVNAAADNDTIYLADGIYSSYGNQNIFMSKKSIRICSASERSENVILKIEKDLTHIYNRAFQVSYCNHVEIQNISIMNGYLAGKNLDSTGGAILAKNSKLLLYNVTFLNNYAESGGGAVSCLMNSDVRFDNCSFFGNSTSLEKGTTILSERSTVISNNCLFIDNIPDINSGQQEESLFWGAVFTNNQEILDQNIVNDIIIRSDIGKGYTHNTESIKNYFSDLSLVNDGSCFSLLPTSLINEETSIAGQSLNIDTYTTLSDAGNLNESSSGLSFYYLVSLYPHFGLYPYNYFFAKSVLYVK